MSNPKQPSISDQLQKLDELTAWFDQDDFDLDEALVKFEEGTKLVEALEARLGRLENKITILKQRVDASKVEGV